MLFRVTGAMESTGQDVYLDIEARDRDEACATARSQGMLVADVHQLMEPHPPQPSYSPTERRQTLDYEHAGASNVASQLQRENDFRDIVTGAKWLNALAILLAAFGGVGFGVFVMVALEVSKVEALIVYVVGVAFLLLSLCVAAILRMLAAIGLAVRETAMNTRVRR